MNEPTVDPAFEECLLSDLAHEFTQRLRQGEAPSVEEYAERYPQLADEVREVFAMLLLMESPQAVMNNTPDGGRNPSGQLRQDHLGEYHILREVGRGGMGVVYEAIQETLGRRVALKVLPKSIVADGRQLERFRREARATANLHHPNIVPVYDVGEADGFHYYAMQFIEGHSLHAVLETIHASPPFSQSDTSPKSSNASSSATHGRSRTTHYRYVARLGKQVAHALAYAHGEGVLHRDIKPGNLMLDGKGTVWITDFGLARVEGQDELTSPGDVVGTLRYLPPERFEGHVDQRGDIYSLGVTLYEILTFRPAFAASTRARLIDQILNDIPAAPRRIDSGIPRDLETIVLKAMSREPTQRYPRADALAEDLDRFITGRPISARRVSVWGHTWRWCRRNTALAAMMALAANLFVAIFVISLVDSVRVRNQLHQTQAARRETRERLFDSLVLQAHGRWRGRSTWGRRFETLDVAGEATELAHQLQLPEEAFARLRDETIGALCLADAEMAQLVDAFPVGTATVDFDPELQRYARASIDGNVTIHRVADNQLLHRLPHPGPGFETDQIWDFGFSPDGRYLKHRCVDRAGKRLVRCWDVSGTEPRIAWELSGQFGDITEFAPDSRHVGVVIHHPPPANDGVTTAAIQAHVIDVATGREVSRPLAADEITRLVFHPTETQLAISDATSVRIIRWDTGDELARWNRPGTQPMAWSPCGRQVLARATDGTDPKIYRWDVRRRRELPPLATPTNEYPYRIVFNHRGDEFLSARRFHCFVWEFRSGRLIWDSPDGPLPGIKFSPDDQLLAGFLGKYPAVRIPRFADGLELRRIPLESPVDEFNGLPRAVMSTDGRMLAATSSRGTVLLDMNTLEELAVIPGIRIPLLFEPNGGLLTHAHGPEGVRRWPIQVKLDMLEIAEVIVGEPQGLTESRIDSESESSLFVGLGQWSSSQDGRVIATTIQRDKTSTGANIFVADGVDRVKYRGLELDPQHDVRHTSVSPDGKYVATGSVSWWAKDDAAAATVTVWDAVTGKRIKDLVNGEGVPRFSHDGQWIAVASGQFPGSVRLWRVGSWEPTPESSPISGPSSVHVAFNVESSLLAVQGYRIRLLVPETGRELAYLSIPEETSLDPQFFTSDGTRLIGFGYNGVLYAWDLRAIRRQLAEMGLDWDNSPK